MRLAYIISAYKLPGQLVRLVKRLDSATSSFFIHVDKKTDAATYAQMVEPLRGYANVFFLERHVCHWGAFGHVQATLSGLHELLARCIAFDYVILLTGQDYPLRSNAELAGRLQAGGGKSFLSHTPLPNSSWDGQGGLERINHWHGHVFNRHWAFPLPESLRPPRSWPPGLQPYGGGSYWCLARPCIDYVAHFVRQHERFAGSFKHVRIPDEIFFQTILLNSPLAATIENNDLRYVDWGRANPTAPGILYGLDVERMLQSPNLFARKFDTTVDAEVLDRLDRVLDATPKASA